MTADQLVDVLLETGPRPDSAPSAAKRSRLAAVQAELEALPDHSDYGSDQYRRRLEAEADKLIAYLKRWDGIRAAIDAAPDRPV